MAIEAAIVPHMKPEDAKQVSARYRAQLKPPEERKPAALQLLDGFHEAGWTVAHVPAPSGDGTSRDETKG